MFYFRMVSSLAAKMQEKQADVISHCGLTSRGRSCSLTHQYKIFPLMRLNILGQRHKGEICTDALSAQPVGGDLEDSPSASCLAMRSCSSRTFFSSSSTRRSSAAMGFRCSEQEDTSDCLRVQVPLVTSCSTTPHTVVHGVAADISLIIQVALGNNPGNSRSSQVSAVYQFFSLEKKIIGFIRMTPVLRCGGVLCV